MSEKRIDDGGPAFPVEVSADSDGYLVGLQTGSNSGFATGLSVRDYFAAKAVQADLSVQGLEGREDLLHIASMAYEMADAMLKARMA